MAIQFLLARVLGGVMTSRLLSWVRDANAIVEVRRGGEEAAMTSAYDYRELHELIDRLEPDQAEELRRHALRLVKPAPSRFRILRSFDGPATDLGARAKDIARAEIGEDDADR